MKLIIELSENDYRTLKEDGVQNHLALADSIIAHSVPYEGRSRGEWLHPYTIDIACECSNCQMQMPITDYFHFCPNCGASMRGQYYNKKGDA